MSVGEVAEVVECGGGGLGAREGLEGREGYGAGCVGYALGWVGVSWGGGVEGARRGWERGVRLVGRGRWCR